MIVTDPPTTLSVSSNRPHLPRPATQRNNMLSRGCYAIVMRFICVAGASSALTKTPRNVIIEKGDEVYMECSTDAFTGSNTITWEHDGPDVTRLTCASIDSSRFNVSRSTTNDCFLVGYANSISGNQGPYHCSDGSGSTAEAVAVLIGSFVAVFMHETLLNHKRFLRQRHFTVSLYYFHGTRRL